jgi:hypothetical protein
MISIKLGLAAYCSCTILHTGQYKTIEESQYRTEVDPVCAWCHGRRECLKGVTSRPSDYAPGTSVKLLKADVAGL